MLSKTETAVRVVTVLPVMGVSSSNGCADISMATLPSRLALLRFRETGRLPDSVVLTVYCEASKADSPDWYWSGCLPSPCSDQEQSSSCSHWGGSGMSAPDLRQWWKSEVSSTRKKVCYLNTVGHFPVVHFSLKCLHHWFVKSGINSKLKTLWTALFWRYR